MRYMRCYTNGQQLKHWYNLMKLGVSVLANILTLVRATLKSYLC